MAAKHPAAFPYAKPIYAAIIAGFGTLVTALDDEQVTGQEIVTIVVTIVVAIGAVFGVTGTEFTPRPGQRKSTPPPRTPPPTAPPPAT